MAREAVVPKHLKRKKPGKLFPGMLLHFENDSVLTGSVPPAPELRPFQVATPTPSALAGPSLEWPRPPAPEAAALPARLPPARSWQRGYQPPAPGAPGYVPRPSPFSNLEATSQMRPGSDLAFDAAPPGSRVSVSVSALGMVLDELANSKDGLVSKEDVFAALRAKPGAPRMDGSQDITASGSRVRASRPASAVRAGEGIAAFKTRPSSAGAISRQSSMPSLQRKDGETGSEMVRALRNEFGQLKKEADNLFAFDQVPTPMRAIAQGARSRERVVNSFDPPAARDRVTGKLLQQRDRSEPAPGLPPSLLNMSRPFSGMRRTVCW